MHKHTRVTARHPPSHTRLSLILPRAMEDRLRGTGDHLPLDLGTDLLLHSNMDQDNKGSMRLLTRVHPMATTIPHLNNTTTISNPTDILVSLIFEAFAIFLLTEKQALHLICQIPVTADQDKLLLHPRPLRSNLETVRHSNINSDIRIVQEGGKLY